MSDPHPAAEPALRHVAVVGGTPEEWAATTEAEWVARLDDLGKVADHAGAAWLTVRPFAPAPLAADTEPILTQAPGPVRHAVVGGCTVTADPAADGRERLVQAMRQVVELGQPITEQAIDDVIGGPARVAPDLVLVLGTHDRLPVSLVWELAYGELVYVDVSWAHLQAEHLDRAIAAYAHRHRRFGGLD